jgi:hypothetical protein
MLIAISAGWSGGPSLRAEQSLNASALNVVPLRSTPTPATPTTAELQSLAEVLSTGNPSVVIDNVTLHGDPRSVGTFSGGAPTIGIATGIILSSGRVIDVLGPNTSDSTSTSFATPGDRDLQTLTPAFPTFDATVLAFDVTPTADHVTFKYVFTSDEYNEYSNRVFNNVFGFFINGVNYALLPDGLTPVSINNVNGGNPSECLDEIDNDGDGVTDGADSDCFTAGDNIVGERAMNPQFFINNDCSDPDGSEIPCIINIAADGLTTVLTLRAPVNPGVANHIRLGVADAGDSVLDSWVFIEAGSFATTAPELCNLDGSPNGINEDGDEFTDEGCRVEGVAINGGNGIFEPGAGGNTETYLLDFDPFGPAVTDATLAITENQVVTAHAVRVFGVLRDPRDIKSRLAVPPFGVTTNCVPIKTTDDSPEMCAEYVVTDAGGLTAPLEGVNYAGPITWVNAFNTSQRFLFGEWGMAHDPSDVAGATFTEDILQSITIDPNEDPIGVSVSDNFSSVIMVFTPDVIVEATRDDALTPPVGTTVDYTPMFTPDAQPVICSPASGTRFSLGINAVSCNATYNAVSASGGFVITVVDTTAPTLAAPLPADQTLEAGAGGVAVAMFTVPEATDEIDTAVAVTCSPAPGTSFPLGSTVVTCTAADDFNNVATHSFTITVGDSVPPVFAAPNPDITVRATSAGGALVTFPTPLASDSLDSAVDVACVAPSGSTFPIGRTTVVCTAVDDSGNTSTTSFRVNVLCCNVTLSINPATARGGQTVSLTATARNFSPVWQRVDLHFDLTSPYSSTIAAVPLWLPPNKSYSITVPFKIPRRAPLGVYTLVLKTSITGVGTMQTHATLTIVP